MIEDVDHYDDDDHYEDDECYDDDHYECDNGELITCSTCNQDFDRVDTIKIFNVNTQTYTHSCEDCAEGKVSLVRFNGRAEFVPLEQIEFWSLTW